MSNRVTIEPTVFKNARGKETTFGVRVYDNESQAYDNTWDAIPDDNLDVLEKVLESDDIVISSMMDFIQENKTGVCIGGDWYDWGEIKDCFSD
jgi:hypothetical protein